MKMRFIAILAMFLLLAACSSEKVVQIDNSGSDNQVDSGSSSEVTTAGPPQFKIMQDAAKRSPPTIFGVVKNVGNGTGSVKVVARVYYAKVVSDEKSQSFENMAPGEEKSFSIEVDETAQWTSYKVFLE